MSHGTLRTFIVDHDDLPAFRAGFFVLSLLSAALLNFGAFGLLILAHMSLDIVKYREIHRYGWNVTLRGVVRENIFDMAFLVLGLLMATVLDPALNMNMVSLAAQGRAMLIRTIAMLVSKLLILSRFAIVLAHPAAHLNATKIATREKWLFGEWLFALLFVILVVMLITVPHLLPVSADEYRSALFESLIPWRI